MARAICLLLFLVLGHALSAAPVLCHPDQALISSAEGKALANFRVEIADDEAERAQGLMNREALAKSAGMLFVYPSERPVAFWMHDTLIPLDMLFIDGAGRVISVNSAAKPRDETPIPSGAPAQFVLEINGGLAQRIGIRPGAILSHPAVPLERAIRPCQ